MWVLDDDAHFKDIFERTGDKFDYDHLVKALEYVEYFRLAVDVGANYGSWSRVLGERFNEVESFEPVNDIFECLCRNTSQSLNVNLHNEAVGNEIKNVSVGVGKMYTNVGMKTVTGDGDIPMITIDSLNLPYLDFLKIDIEGFEYFALLGAIETIKKHKPIIIFEENIRGELEHNIEPGKCEKLLNSLGAVQIDKIKQDFIYGWK